MYVILGLGLPDVIPFAVEQPTSSSNYLAIVLNIA